MPIEWSALKEALRQQALAEGFAVAAFAPPAPPPHAEYFCQWLQQNAHGEMAWLARTPERRTDPRHLLNPLGTILVLGSNDCPANTPVGVAQDASRGVIAAYARHRDYHTLLQERLQRLAAWLENRLGQPVAKRLLVDTGPLLEKPLASAAGLGWQGKNSLLVSPRFGCRLLLAELLLPLPLPPDGPLPNRCGTCRRCLEACPTAALAHPYRLEARHCLAYFTIEQKGPIPTPYRAAMGNRIYGCDDCLAACPWNRFAPVTQDVAWLPRPALVAPALLTCAALDEVSFCAMMQHTPLERIGVVRFLRNVAVALGNWGAPEALPALIHLLHHAAPLVRGHAAWGLGQLANLPRNQPLGATIEQWLAEQAQRETDPWVGEEIGLARHRMAASLAG